MIYIRREIGFRAGIGRQRSPFFSLPEFDYEKTSLCNFHLFRYVFHFFLSCQFSDRKTSNKSDGLFSESNRKAFRGDC
jgi:hypothetical protein